MCPTFHCNLTVWFTFNCLIQSNVEVTVKKTVNQLYNYFTVLGAKIRCKLYGEITVEIGTHLDYIEYNCSVLDHAQLQDDLVLPIAARECTDCSYLG